MNEKTHKADGTGLTMDYQDLGRRIRDCRKSKKMTQEQLAEMTGISASFLGHIERGSRVASIDTLVALCNALNVRADYLLAGSLNTFDGAMSPGLSDAERGVLRKFIKLAQDSLLIWD